MKLIALRITLVVIIAFQVILGIAFLFFPAPFAAAAGLEAAPPWTSWMLAMFSARALGFAVGLSLAVRDPFRYRAWIAAMAGVQGIDWLATIYFVATEAVTLTQVSTASFVPVLYIVVVALVFPRRAGTRAAAHEPSQAVGS